MNSAIKHAYLYSSLAVIALSLSSYCLFSSSPLFASSIEKSSNLSSEKADKTIEDDKSKNGDSNETNEEKSDESSEGSSNSPKIRNFLSENVKAIFDTIDRKAFTDDIYKELNLIYNHFESVYFNDDEKFKLADLAVLNFLNQKGLLNNSRSDAEKIIEDTFENYSNQMKNRYSDEQYQQMLEKSVEFGNHAKHTKSCDPKDVIMSSDYKILQDFPIIYNDNILISLNDVINLTGKDYKIEYMKNNQNIILKNNENIVEISPGDNFVYINEKQEILNNPVINWKGNLFISTDIFDHLDNNIPEGCLRTINFAQSENSSAKVIIF